MRQYPQLCGSLWHCLQWEIIIFYFNSFSVTTWALCNRSAASGWIQACSTCVLYLHPCEQCCPTAMMRSNSFSDGIEHIETPHSHEYYLYVHGNKEFVLNWLWSLVSLKARLRCSVSIILMIKKWSTRVAVLQTIIVWPQYKYGWMSCIPIARYAS